MTDSVTIKDEFSSRVILGFVPTSCSIELSQDSDYSAISRISMHLRPKSRCPNQYAQIITAPEGHSLQNAVWMIDIRQGQTTSEYAKALGAIGLLRHFPAIDDDDNRMEETCVADAYLQHEQFTALQTFVMSGRLPSYVQIFVQENQTLFASVLPGEIFWNVQEGKDSTAFTEPAGIKALCLSLAIEGVRGGGSAAKTHQEVP